MDPEATDQETGGIEAPDASRNRHPMRKALVFVVLLIALVACAVIVLADRHDRLPAPPKADDAGSTAAGVGEVVAANNRFAFDLYSQLASPENDNLFFSPYSISVAMAMTYEGAAGETAEEMRSVLHFPNRSVLRPNTAAIYSGLNEGGKDYELATGNALWVQQDFPLLPEYTSAVEKYYGGRATELDFIGATEESRQTINDFIEEQTRGKIKDLIPEGALGELARLVLTDATYFKGTWRWEFDPSDTHDGDFHVSPTETVTAHMMTMAPDESFNYADVDGLQVLQLPYKGGDISMLVLLPKEDLASVESGLTAERLDEYRAAMHETKLGSISLPRFEFDAKYSLADTLGAMGMPVAFQTDAADFSGMTGDRSLSISDVIHQAYVKVDEKGTEAAAATGIVIGATAMPTSFVADHPFLFLIQEEDTGNILFLGRVVDPTA